MVEGGGRLRFTQQPAANLVVARRRVAQELDGDLAVQPRVVGEEHLSHAAAAETAQQLVVRDRSEWLGHGRRQHLAKRECQSIRKD